MSSYDWSCPICKCIKGTAELKTGQIIVYCICGNIYQVVRRTLSPAEPDGRGEWF